MTTTFFTPNVTHNVPRQPGKVTESLMLIVTLCQKSFFPLFTMISLLTTQQLLCLIRDLKCLLWKYFFS